MSLRNLLPISILLVLPTLALAQDFIPLTNLPGLTETVNSDTLPVFLNNIYKLCIGAAAVIAIIQIMRAGAYFMFNKGSVTQNVKAKELITNAVLGLLLVLSPAIVFGIINRDILNLKLDVSKLSPTNPPTETEQQVQEIIEGYKEGTATGTVLRKAVVPNETAMNAFVFACSSSVNATPGVGSAKGCTKTCTAGSTGCDVNNCSEYTAYCSIKETVTVKPTGGTGSSGKPQTPPVPEEQGKYDTFASSCSADGGTFGAYVDFNDPVFCPGTSAGISKAECYKASMLCSPK